MSRKLLSILLIVSMLFTMLPIAAIAEATDAPFDTDFEIIDSEPLGASIEDTELSDYLTDTVEATPGSDIEEDTELQTVADAVYDSEEEELMEDNTVSDELPEITGMMEAAAAPMMMLTAGGTTVSEQFTRITPGSTYYFDLSSEKDKIDEVNTNLPDTTLHYVPFTYVGTVYAYSLNSRSLDNNDAKTDSVTADGNTTDPEHAIGYKSDRSLFVSDYNVSNISWLVLNSSDLIFGKTFNTNYKLRVLSAGSNSNSAGDHYMNPDANEWDQILAKSSDWIKNWSGIWSWGQDTMADDDYGRMTRGNTSTYDWKNVTYYFSNGFRPALEVLNPDTLGSDGLKEVTLNLNGGSLNGSTDNIKIICAGDSFTAPSSDGLTAPAGKAFDGWKDTSSETIYAEGADVPHTVDGLTAQWGNDFVQNIETGETYGTLQGAVDAVTDGQTIKLLKDIKEKDITINNSHSFTLELNGKILNSGKDKAITQNGNGTLKITDNSDGSGKVTNANTYAAGTIYLHVGSLEVAGGTVENTGPYASCSAVYNEGSGSVIVSGGNIISGQGSTIYNSGSGNVNVSDGTVKGNVSVAIQNDSAGNVNISGGTVEGIVYNLGSGSVNISGGIVKQTGTDNAVCNLGNGKITISGTAKVSSANTSSTGGTIFLINSTAANTVLEIKGGTIENTAAGGNGIYNGGDGKIIISSGSPVIIKGDGMAINKVPDLSGYTDVKISASSDVTGSNATVIEKEALTDSSLINYKYLKFETNTDFARIGAQGYSSLQAAIDAVDDNETIKLMKNVEENITITNSKSFTIDLNGCTIDGGSNIAIWHRGSGLLTVKDTIGEGRITSAIFAIDHGTIQLEGGSLELESGTVEKTASIYSSHTIYNNGAGNVTISGGTVRHNSNHGYAIYNASSGKVLISNGIVSSTVGHTIYLESTGELEITGGTVENNNTAIYIKSSGSVDISGGNIRSTNNSPAICHLGSGKITVSGTAEISSSCSQIFYGTIYIMAEAASNTVLEISGGTIDNNSITYGIGIYNDALGKINILDGSPIIIRGSRFAINKAPDLSGFPNVKISADTNKDGNNAEIIDTLSNDSITSYKYLKFEPEYVARIGSQGYSSLQDAFTAVTDGQKIIMSDDITYTNGETITTGTTDKSFTLDLNGFTIDGGSGTESLIKHENAGTLIIIDGSEAKTGTIKSNRTVDNSNDYRGTIYVKSSDGSLVINGITVKNEAPEYSFAIYVESDGDIEINNSTVSSNYYAVFNNLHNEVFVNNSTITGGKSGIFTYSTSNITISGSTIIGEGDGENYYGIAFRNSGQLKIIKNDDVPTIIQGKNRATTTAPNLSGYTDVKISASTDVTGSGAAIIEKDALTNSNITNYKYLKFETNNDVARIGSQGYSTLQAAVDAVADEQTIRLVKDIDFTAGEIITTGISNRDFTLDLNGFMLNGGSGSSPLIRHNNAGTLTITDSQTGGKITSNRASSFSLGTIATTANGSLIIDGGTVENTLENIDGGYDAGIAINNRGTGYVKINNGTVSANFAAIYNNSSGSVIVNDGTITGTGNGIYSPSSGSVTVSGGDFCSNGPNARAILVAGSGSVTVSGGTLSPIGENADVIYIAGSSSVTISGGTLSPNGANARAVAIGGSGIINVTISGGTLSPIGANAKAVYVFDSGTTTVTISGGTISAEGEKAYGVYSLLDNVIKIHGGGSSPVIIKGQFKAMNKAPDLSEYANVAVTASEDYSGSPVVAYNADFIGDYKYLKFEPVVPLTGTVTISGTPKYGKTLTAAYGSGNNSGVLSYQWKRSGSDISGANGNTYTIVETDIGQTLTCVVTSSMQTGSVSSDPTATISKADGPAAPTGLSGVAPSGADIMDGKITGTNTTMEYANNTDFIDAQPCSGSEITGLSAGTYYVRVQATTAHKAGAYTAVTVPAYVPNALTGTATISNTTPRIGDVLNGSLVDHNNTGSLTFVWKADGAEIGTGASYTVTKADLGKTITLEISSSVESGTITSAATWAVLKKAAPTAPDAPILVSKTRNSVTLKSNALYEFSKDGSTWQTSNVFDGLTARTAYTFYQRIAETDDTESSAASTGLSVTTDASSGGSGGGRSSDRGKSSGSSGSSANSSTPAGGSSVITITPPAPDKPDAPTQGEIKVKANADEKGNAVVNITGQNVTDVINKATEAAQKNGNAQNGITMILNVVTDGKPVSNVKVNLPKVVQDTIIARRIVNTIVVVDNPNIRISMDLPTVEAINRQANSDVNVTASRRSNSELTGDARKATGSRPVFDLKVNYGSGRQVQSFGDGSVWVTIPYTLGENEKAENICAVYIDENGKVHWLTDSVYDSVEKVLRFRTNHFSTYGVGYKEEALAFTDIAGHWAKGDIEFVVNRGLFSGTSETTFSPDIAMTRGMFITVLGRLATADVSSYKQSSFTDVKDDAYYMGYIEWARKNGIVGGTTDGKFLPDAPVTREQMAVIMSNYAKNISFTLPKMHMENVFTDSDKIGTNAKDAVEQMQMAGVLSGKNGNLFEPQGTATRAEVSAVLRRFVELTISSDTM